MPGDAELLGRIEGGESDRVEFTASIRDLDKFRQAICAFANGRENPAIPSHGGLQKEAAQLRRRRSPG